MHSDLSPFIREAIDKYFLGEEFRDEVLSAKDLYFTVTGMVDDQKSDYELRMQMFNDWFLFDYIPNQRQVPYVIEYINSKNLENEEVKKSLSSVIYSVFEFKKKSFSKNMILKDLVSGEKYELTPGNFPFGILPGEVIVARVLNYNNEAFPLAGIRYIPKELKSLIAKEGKSIFKTGNPSEIRKFVLALEKFKSKCEQYAHIDPLAVYKKFGFER